MLAVLVYLSLVAACVVVGMTYGRWSVGSCCGCAENCSLHAGEYFDGSFGNTPPANLNNWLTSGTVTYSGGKVTLAAGAWMEWDADGPSVGGLRVATNSGQFRLHIAHGNGNGFYAEYDYTANTVNLYDHGGTKLNTFVGNFADLFASSNWQQVEYDGSLLSATADHPSTGYYPTCAPASGATGLRVRIEAVTQTEVLYFEWRRYGSDRDAGCVFPRERCSVCDDCDMPTSVSVSYSGCTSGTVTCYPSTTDLEADDAVPPCRYIGTGGSVTAEVTLTDEGTNVGIELELSGSWSGGLCTFRAQWDAQDTGTAKGSCGMIGTEAMGAADTWITDTCTGGGSCQASGGLSASVTV